MGTPTKREWRIVALDDGTPWVTNGIDEGFNPDAIPAVLGAMQKIADCQNSHISITDGAAWFASGDHLNLWALLCKANARPADLSRSHSRDCAKRVHGGSPCTCSKQWETGDES